MLHPASLEIVLRPERYKLAAASGTVRVILVGTGVRPIPPPGYGGIERTLSELSRALQAEGVEVEILNEVHPGRTGEYAFARALKRRIGDLTEGVVHASTPVVASRLNAMRLPYVYTTHSRHWFSVRGMTERWGFRLERRAVLHAQRAIALTATVRSRIQDVMGPHLDPDRLTTIGLGVDLDRFGPRADCGDPRVALGIGVLLPVKRWEWAAQALEGTGIRLRLVGPATDPGYARRLERFACVELVGELNDDGLVKELSGAGMLVHPSSAELFPGVVAQAMACGRPVVGLPPIASFVEEGVTGFIVGSATSGAAEAIPALRRAAIRLRDDEPLRVTLGRAARGIAVREFDWRSVARAHIEVYRQVSPEGKGAGGLTHVAAAT